LALRLKSTMLLHSSLSYFCPFKGSDVVLRFVIINNCTGLVIKRTWRRISLCRSISDGRYLFQASHFLELILAEYLDSSSALSDIFAEIFEHIINSGILLLESSRQMSSCVQSRSAASIGWYSSLITILDALSKRNCNFGFLFMCNYHRIYGLRGNVPHGSLDFVVLILYFYGGQILQVSLAWFLSVWNRITRVNFSRSHIIIKIKYIFNIWVKKTYTAKQSTLTLTHISNQTEATSKHSFLSDNHHRIIAQATERTEMSTPLGRFNSGNNGFKMSPTNVNGKGRRLLKHNTQSTGMRSHRTSINFTKDRFNSTVIYQLSNVFRNSIPLSCLVLWATNNQQTQWETV
jgi:hypothetical protein